jgi:PemK-like, MazF-like toxin of type II toxin-antitoxin system
MIWIDCNPEAGREMKDIQPLLARAPREFNERTGIVIGLPMTTARASARVRAMLPKAAQLDTRQIEMGLAGDEREALKARVFLREAFGGEIRLEADAARGLTAHWMQQSACLTSAAMGCRPSGSGRATWHLYSGRFSMPEGVP